MSHSVAVPVGVTPAASRNGTRNITGASGAFESSSPTISRVARQDRWKYASNKTSTPITRISMAPTRKEVLVSDLHLDLKNFRTVTQKNEANEIVALSVIDSEYFWGLAASLINDGYMATENIVVQKCKKNGETQLVVREGNRRVAILKILLGLSRPKDLRVPDDMQDKLALIDKPWKEANSKVPCLIYGINDSELIDRIVSLTHGKADKAKRKDWNSVAHARHNREKNGATENGLTLLEAFLKNCVALTDDQKRFWAGDYSLSVLDDAIPRFFDRFACASVQDLIEQYQKGKLKNRTKLEAILKDIGLGTLGFPHLRKGEDVFVSRYGLTPRSTSKPPPPANPSSPALPAPPPATPTGKSSSKPLPNNVKARPWTDPKAVQDWFKVFHPAGSNRQKLVLLVQEARTLNIEKHPHSFCFLLRSMFEHSAKLYCDDNRTAPNPPKCLDSHGKERSLKDILSDVCRFYVGNPIDKQKQKEVHGAMAVLGQPNSFLSVTSLNQLVHNPGFSIDAVHIGPLFGNVAKLLLIMNS